MPRKKQISKTGTKTDPLTGQTKRMKEALLEELAKYPIIQIACQRTGVGRSTFYKWKKQDEEFSNLANTAVSEGKQFTNEMAESQLIKSIGNGNMTGIIFWLKNNHADYTDRVRYEHHHTHELELSEEESRKISLAFSNIGLANLLKSEGFTYTKEEAAEAERIITMCKIRRKKFEKEEDWLKRRDEYVSGVNINSTAKKEVAKMEEKEIVEPDVNGKGPVDMTDIVITPGMTAGEINQQFMERDEWRRRQEQKRRRGEKEE